jgi:hypothetical protein
MESLKGAKVVRISYAEAKAIVVRYEWRRSMPSGTLACYGLKDALGELAGAVVFAAGPVPESGDLCGPEHRMRTI